MNEAKKQAGEIPKAINPQTNPSWLKLTARIAQTELQLKGGNLTPAEASQFESQLNRDQTKLVEVEAAINCVNTAPTTGSQDRRETELNRREGQLRAGEQALVEREAKCRADRTAIIERETVLNDRERTLLDLQQQLEALEVQLTKREEALDTPPVYQEDPSSIL